MDAEQDRDRTATDVMRYRVWELVQNGWHEKDILRYLKSTFHNVTRDLIRSVKNEAVESDHNGKFAKLETPRNRFGRFIK